MNKINPCMRHFFGVDKNCKLGDNHSHAPDTFRHVGIKECKNGSKCFHFKKKIQLSDGRVSNLCSFKHNNNSVEWKEQEVKKSVSNGWMAYQHGYLEMDKIFDEKASEDAYSEWLFDIY